MNHLIGFQAPRPGGDVIDVYRDLDLGRDGAGDQFRSWNRGISGGLGPIQATLSGKGWFQGHGVRPATKCSTWNMGIPGVMGPALPRGAKCPTGEGGPDDPPGRAGRWLPRPGQAAGARMPHKGGRARPPLCGAGFSAAASTLYPCTEIGSWWTTVQFCPVKREIGGDRPLQDVSSEHPGSRAASTPAGQCQLRNRTVCPAGWDGAGRWCLAGPGRQRGRSRR